MAFGMGIDKANGRFVFHYHISPSLDPCYQQIGRAGRDGQRALARLFYRPEDLGIWRFFASGGRVNTTQIERVGSMLDAREEPVDPEALRDATALSETKLRQALSGLAEVGAVEFLPTGEVVMRGQAEDLNAAAPSPPRAVTP